MGVLEHLVPGNWDTARRNFERLDRLFSLVSKNSDGLGFSVAGVNIRFGQATLTWNGTAVRSAALSVTHKLGRTPLGVLATPIGGLSAGAGIAFAVPSAYSYGATTFTLQAATSDETTPTATSSIFWLAVG